jgi:hypothetical protein
LAEYCLHLATIGAKWRGDIHSSASSNPSTPIL